MAQSLSSLQKSDYLFKVDYFDFSCKKMNNYFELDARVIACNFYVFRNFAFFSAFSAQMRLFLNQK